MDYLYIRAWGKMLGSFPAYIEREVEKARKAKAPQTAIYQRQDGSWATFGSVSSGETRDAVALIVKQMKEGV
ncbi:MAG: hypothetical protein IJ364_05400 [Oscillospiraceae bacterium]|nr:hypothetical protein [Oscillospiraceae bacterium]